MSSVVSSVKMEDHHLIAALSVNLVTVNLLLSVFFLPGVWADGYCPGKVSGLHITTPNTMEALSGSCLLIPCSFTADNFNSSTKASGVWIRRNNDIFDISKSVKSFPVSFTGDLSERDCTTVFSDLKTSDSEKYFLRMENRPFIATACDEPLQVTVRDSPWSPKIVISGDVMDLKEKQSVSITCSALTPCPLSPPELTWNLQSDSHRQTETNTDGTITTKIQENITLSDTHDGYNISCSVRYPVDGGKGFKTAETEVTLHVSYAPKNTSSSISPSGLVSAGGWVNLSCSSRANPPASFSWFRISSEGPVRVSEEQIYRFQMTKMTDEDMYFCMATNIIGSQMSPWKHEDNPVFGVSPHVTLKIVGIVILCSSIIIFECWFRFSNKPEKDREETDYVNTVTETQAS